MNPKMLLVAGALLLAGCNDTYIQGDDSYPGAGYGDYQVSERTMVRNCEDVVEYRLHRKLGRKARIDFERTSVWKQSRERARVEGRVHVRHHGDTRTMEYWCRVNTRNGTVLEHHLDRLEDGDAVGGKRNRKALELCRERIRHRLRKEVPGDFRIEFHDPKVYKISKRLRRVTGEARLVDRHGSGWIEYSCKVHFEPREIDSASWSWLRRLPTSASNGGSNRETARQICHRAMRDHLEHKGHRQVRFLDTRVKLLWEKTKLVKMKVRSRLHGEERTSHHSCRVDMKTGRVLELE